MKCFALMAFLSVLVTAGCRSTFNPETAGAPTITTGLEDVRVAHIFNPRTEPFASGTAIPIGGNRLVSCRHNFPPYLDSLWVNGRTVPIAMQRSGGNDNEILEDWCEFEVQPGIIEIAPNTTVDFTRKVQPGEAIYFIGFYGGPRQGIDREVALSLPKQIVKGTVVAAPADWSHVRDNVIFADAPEQDAYHGISGGAAVVHDDSNGRWIVVGLYRGAAVESQELLGWKWKGRTYHTILRPPIK